MSSDFEKFIAQLKLKMRRLELSDSELLEAFWQAHPRFQFFKSLPWDVNLLDIGAGEGGLAFWKTWLKPERTDVNLYGVDRKPGEYRALYAGWEAIDLDRDTPQFAGIRFDGFFITHLIEYLGAPERLIEWLGTRAEPGARLYLEWSGPMTLDLPSREQLARHDIDVVSSNFIDDSEHKQTPELERLCDWLSNAGLAVIASGAIDTGILGEELFARGTDRDSRSMGYWSMTRSSLYAVAVRSETTVATRRKLEAAAEARPAAAPEAMPAVVARTSSSQDVALLRAKRALLISGLFDAAFYRETYADMRVSSIDPLTHYLTRGEAEGRSPNPVFAPGYYRRRWMAGAPAQQNALLHYVEEGERLGYKPHPAFDPQAYLAANTPLADFVDRPLFHYLAIGRDAGLPVAPGPHGEALARVLGAQPHAADFEYSGRRNHYQLMRYKQTLVRELGVDAGFALYKEMFDLPDSDQIALRPVASLYEFAKQHAATFHEIDPGGEPFTMPPPHVIGDGNHRVLEGVSRAIFVTCLIDARVRARSGFVAMANVALLDYQGDELSRIDDELDFDPAVFHAEQDAVWLTGPDEGTDTVELDEAFMLLGPHSDGFGHWMLDLLPRYIAASASGALPPVPVLIDQSMPATQRECLRLVLAPGTDIIELPPHTTAQVRRLWYAPSQMHWAVQPKVNERWKWDDQATPRHRFAGIIRDTVDRLAPLAGTGRAQERVYLARRPWTRHALVNAAEIEAAAAARGFALVYPEEMAFAEQVRFVRDARFIIGPEGSQLLLAWFCKPGTKLCHLCHPYTAELPLQTGLLDEIGVKVTVLTGSYVALDREYPEQSDYRIDIKRFREFLDPWLGDEPRQSGLMAGAANVFSYWDKPDLTPIVPFIAEWRSHFPNFTILGDSDIEPLIEEFFPEHLEMYRRIRIPTAKSDVALLLALYKYGGLHVDAHCGIRDAGAVRALLDSFDDWEVILYDKDRKLEPRPASQIYPINSVLFARRNSPIILETAKKVFDNLARHWAAEKERGFHPYDIWVLTLPGSLHPTLLVNPESAVSQVKPEYVHRVRFLQEGPGEPIGRYMNHSYRVPEMHWSVRQEHELLFDLEPDTDPWHQSVALSATIPGWINGRDAEELARISFDLPDDATIVEIGTFLGRSAVLLAGPRKVRGSGRVHCVDPFDGSGDAYSVPHYRELLRSLGGGSLQEHFVNNIRRAGLSNWIEMHQGCATEVAASWTKPIDLLLLDGDQSPEGARSAFNSWARFLKPGGYIVLRNAGRRDYAATHDGHRRLADEAVVAPAYNDIRQFGDTVFARKC